MGFIVLFICEYKIQYSWSLFLMYNWLLFDFVCCVENKIQLLYKSPCYISFSRSKTNGVDTLPVRRYSRLSENGLYGYVLTWNRSCAICMSAQSVVTMSQRHTFTALNSTFVVDTEYQFVKELGQGAYGCVVAAKHRRSGEGCAIKKITNINTKVCLVSIVLLFFFSLELFSFPRWP